MNKGFQALPEYVQRKIDPEMTKKYMGGGTVMQRPLFRQAGGPAEADMAQMAAMGQQFLMPQAQQPMAPQQVDPQQAAMVQAQEQHNMEDGQKVGEMYASEMMSRLDGAEDPKGMIDAFRGNEKPLEARYTELAGFVGEADANKTPESVLAMVQPTIMMTEEGAVDSGIGELMQGLVQSVEMEDDSQMAQGVGELMAMGAGNTPPVNFNQGGAVRHYAEAGPVISEAQKMAPDFQAYFEGAFDKQARAAALQEQKEMTQAQMLFDIAGTALNFAGNTQGRSIAERLANAASQTQLTDKIGTRAAGILSAKQAQAAEERQIRMAARQGALGQAQTNKKAADDLELATARKSSTDPSFRNVVDSKGKVIGTFNVNSTTGLENFEKTLKENPGANVFKLATQPAPSDSTDPEFKRIIFDGKDLGTFNVNNKDDLKLFKTTLANNPGASAYNLGTQPAPSDSTDPEFKRIIFDGKDLGTFNVNNKDDLKLFKTTLADNPGASAYNLGTQPADNDPTPPEFKRIIFDGKDLGTFNVNDKDDLKLFKTTLADNPGASAYNLGTKSDTKATDFTTIKLYPKDGKGDSLTINVRTEADYIKLTELTGKDGKYTASSEAYTNRLSEDSAQKVAEQTVKSLTIYDSTDATALPKTFNINNKKQRDEYNRLIVTGNWTDSPKAYDLNLMSKQEQTQYERNRADEQTDIDAQVARDIEARELELGYTLNKEQREKIEFNRRLAVETNLRIEAEQRAKKLELSREERANVEYRARLAVQEQIQVTQELRVLEQKGNYKIIEKDGQVFAIDNATLEQTLIFGTKDIPEPEYKEITLPSADGSLVTTVVDITSPQGKQAIALVNQVSLDGGQASMRNIPTANIIPRGFFVPDEGIFTSYDGGKTYVDNDGVAKNVPGGAYEVSNQIAYDVAKKEKVKANALQQLKEMDAVLASGVTDENGNFLSAKDRLEVIDAYTEARKGTGFWSKIAATIDAIAGGVLAPEYFAETFKDTQEARKFVKMVRVLGRSALAVSPRFAVADLEQVAQLFPNEEALFTNPVTEAKKLQTIAGYLDQQKVVILENLAGDVPLDKTLQAQLQQKLFEINRLQEILGPINSIGASQSSQDAFNEAVGLIGGGVKPGVKK